MITIFTPTYNRKKELKRLYDSLIKQNNKNFEWLIVDDGSTDETDKYVSKLKKENKITINYYYKKNGGKCSAYNYGLELAKGNIFLCCDSDDIMSIDAVEQIENDYKKIQANEKICGVAYLKSYLNDKEKVVGNNFISDGFVANYYDLYNKYKLKGDKLFSFKTSVAKKYKFPIIENEKFIPEALIYNRISKKFDFLCKNIIVNNVEYLENGYSSNYFDLVKRNPLGNRLYFKEKYDLEPTFYNVYGYILFSFYGKVKIKEIFKEHRSKIKVLLLFLPTYIISKLK